jgi:hypothetical protein
MDHAAGDPDGPRTHPVLGEAANSMSGSARPVRRTGSVVCPPGLLVVLVAAAPVQTGGFNLAFPGEDVFLLSPGLRGRVPRREIFLPSPIGLDLGGTPGADRMDRPLLAATASADQALWRSHPGASHAASALAHLVAVLLVWRPACGVTGSRWAAFAGGALLAAHPSAVGAMACPSARTGGFTPQDRSR